MTASRVDRYRQLCTQIGEEPCRALIDRLQVLALTQPDTLREVEALIDRGFAVPRFPVYPNPDRRRNPDRRQVCVVSLLERRRGVRRQGDRSTLASHG
jgi:hypothetical protein